MIYWNTVFINIIKSFLLYFVLFIEMDPKTISLLIGDNATITCNLYDPNSSLIWFYEERSHRSIQQPSEYIKVNIVDCRSSNLFTLTKFDNRA